MSLKSIKTNLTKFDGFASWKVIGREIAVLGSAASLICSKQFAASLWGSHQVFFSTRIAKIQTAQPYSSIFTVTTFKNFRFTFSDRLHFHMLNNLSIAVQDFHFNFSWGDIVAKIYELAN